MSLALKNLTILVVDDEADDCEDLRSLLEKSGASVMVARSVEDALELQRKYPPHVLIADVHLGSSVTLSLMRLRKTSPSTEASRLQLRSRVSRLMQTRRECCWLASMHTFRSRLSRNVLSTPLLDFCVIRLLWLRSRTNGRNNAKENHGESSD
jgi:CheY-like chemotaxis protein